VHGTPADCVRVGLHRLCPDAGLVLSGVNHGGIPEADAHYSDTVAGVREAVPPGWAAAGEASTDRTRPAAGLVVIGVTLLARPRRRTP
jgi:5'-nucleotidase